MQQIAFRRDRRTIIISRGPAIQYGHLLKTANHFPSIRQFPPAVPEVHEDISIYSCLSACLLSSL